MLGRKRFNMNPDFVGIDRPSAMSKRGWVASQKAVIPGSGFKEWHYSLSFKQDPISIQKNREYQHRKISVLIQSKFHRGCSTMYENLVSSSP
jgi:hypothetical protein